MKNVLKLSATALIIAGANMLLSQSALACSSTDFACQQQQQIQWQLQNDPNYCNYGYNPNCGNRGSYGVTGSNYPSQPTTKTECQMLNNGYQSCIHYSLSTGAIVIKEMINPKISRPISQIFYQPNGQIVSERYFDAQGEKHGTEKFYSLVNDKGKTKLDKKVEWNNGVQVR